MSTVVFVSDLHLQGPGDATQQDFLRFLFTGRFDELVLVGDLFDLWLCPDGHLPYAAQPVIEALRSLAVPVTWLGGNHDPRPRAAGIRTARRWRGQGVFAAHGDGFEGLPHRAVRRLLGSRPAHLAARVLGPDRVFELGKALSAARRNGHHPEKHARTLAAQQALADRWLLGADTVVFGHTHAPGVVERPGGRYLNVGDWYQHRTFGRLERGEVRLFHWLDGGEEELTGPPRRRPELLG